MCKAIRIFLVLNYVITHGLPAITAQTTFQRVICSSIGAHDDGGNSLSKTDDGGYILCGTSKNYSNGVEYDLYLIRTNMVGDTLWSRRYGNVSGDESGYCVIQTSDGGFITTGYSTSFGSGYRDIYLLKTDSIGTVEWTTAFGGNNEECGLSIQQCADSGFIITGWTNSFGAGDADALVWRTDKSGNTEWAKTYGGTSYDFGISVVQTNDGGYVITGQTASFGDTLGDLYLVKMDSSGNLQWSYLYGQNGFWETGNSVHQTIDGGFIIVGGSRMLPNIDSDVYLIRTDSSGTYQWSKSFGGTAYDMGDCVIPTTDGGYAIAGNTMSFGFGHTDAYIIKTDSTGNMQWSRAFGGVWYDQAKSLTQSGDDAGFAVVGYAQISPGGIFFIKTDSLGNSGCNEITPSTVQNNISTLQQIFTPTILTQTVAPIPAPTTTYFPNSVDTSFCLTVSVNETTRPFPITLYPNPAVSSISIQSEYEGGNYLLLDLTGNLIQCGSINNENFIIDISSIPPGVYFLRLTSENETVTSQFVKIE